MSDFASIKNLDFTPLSSDIKAEDFTPEEVKAHGFDYMSSALGKKLRNIALVAGAVLLALCVLLPLSLPSRHWIFSVSFISMSFTVPLFAIGGLVFFIVNWSRFPNKAQLRWMMFAKRNGLAYHNPKATSSNLENLNTMQRIESLKRYITEFGLDGVFFKRGVNSFDNFVDLDSRTTCFEHCKTIKSQHDDKTESYYFNVVRYDFGRHVPNILLDGLGNINPMVGGRYEAQTLRLEGDFNKHFKVFAPPGYHIDALQILTPDVMADLVDHAAKYDIELIDHYVYIAAVRKIKKGDYGAFTQDFFAHAGEVIKELSEQVDAYVDRHDPAEFNARLKLK